MKPSQSSLSRIPVLLRLRSLEKRHVVEVVQQLRCVSSYPPMTTSSGGANDKDLDNHNLVVQDEDEESFSSSLQPFVKTRIESGEWDPDTRTNPLYRPKWKTRARIISAEDFANRPRVGIGKRFKNFQEAMVTVSWLDEKEHKQMYQLYLDLMTFSQNKYQVTSHEYVMRVIAQKFNMTPERAAAIVQLQHNEEQFKIHEPDRPMLTKLQADVDAFFKQEIRDAYQTFGLKQPDEFVEDPVASLGKQDDKSFVAAEDVIDVDKVMKETIVREDNNARTLIDGHVYIEDKDDEAIEAPLSKHAKKLMRAQQNMKTFDKTEVAVPWPEKEDKRDRWKYVAQIVNTRQLKKARAKSLSYINNDPTNTLVEHNGTVRPATMADVKLTSWKPVRHVNEFIYQHAKKGWLDRTVRGDTSKWGKASSSQIEAAKATKSIGVGDEDEHPIDSSNEKDDIGSSSSDSEAANASKSVDVVEEDEQPIDSPIEKDDVGSSSSDSEDSGKEAGDDSSDDSSDDEK